MSLVKKQKDTAQKSFCFLTKSHPFSSAKNARTNTRKKTTKVQKTNALILAPSDARQTRALALDPSVSTRLKYPLPLPVEPPTPAPARALFDSTSVEAHSLRIEILGHECW